MPYARPDMQQASPPSGSPVHLSILGTAAIPLGHEVELVTYVKPKRGFLANVLKYDVLTDLNTGVVYMPFFDVGQAPPWEEADVEVERRVRGRVMRCHVQTMTHADGTAVTRLLLDAGPLAHG
jgi:hypothetical protein